MLKDDNIQPIKIPILKLLRVFKQLAQIGSIKRKQKSKKNRIHACIRTHLKSIYL